jgi:hypothetical protein
MSGTKKPIDATIKPTAPVEAVKEPEAIPFAEFLEVVPPSQQRKVKKLFAAKKGTPYFQLSTPELQLHCTSPSCNGLRFFRYQDGNRTRPHDDAMLLTYLTFVCSNCQTTQKTYSLYTLADESDQTAGKCYKFGELPPYGPPTPARLIKLFEDERENFLKGRRCESQGLGIGAFSYYRRVVENKKNRILDEVIRVCEKIGAPPEMIKVLQDAKAEVQFTKALEDVKDVIPQALLINGNNPFTLLHRPLSRGLHELSDEQCLAIAHDVRVVLVELAERLGQALKDEAEINTAINRLLSGRIEG